MLCKYALDIKEIGMRNIIILLLIVILSGCKDETDQRLKGFSNYIEELG